MKSCSTSAQLNSTACCGGNVMLELRHKGPNSDKGLNRTPTLVLRQLNVFLVRHPLSVLGLHGLSRQRLALAVSIVAISTRPHGSLCCVAQAASCRPEIALRCCLRSEPRPSNVDPISAELQTSARARRQNRPSACLRPPGQLYPQRFRAARSRSMKWRSSLGRSVNAVRCSA